MTRNRCGDLFGYSDALSELIQKAIDHRDDINIPGIKIPLLSCVLKQADGYTGADVGACIGSNLLQKEISADQTYR